LKLSDVVAVLVLLSILYGVLYFIIFMLRQPSWSVPMRRSLSHLPPVVMPDGYRLRVFQPGDEEVWVRLIRTSFATEKGPYVWNRWDDVVRSFSEVWNGSDGEGILFVERKADGMIVGTVGASEKRLRRKRIGMVVWMAVHPEHRGRGLGTALLAAALHAIALRGLTEAILYTNPALLTALRLYDRGGFVPEKRRDVARLEFSRQNRE
jgi:mycothiol synthase